MSPSALLLVIPGILSAACAGHASTGSTPAVPAPGPAMQQTIDEISLERRCVGCDRQYQVVFRRDGTAARTDFGNARARTADRAYAGTVSPAAFDALARLVRREGFLALDEAYRQTGVADGEWAVTAIIQDGRRKAVTNSNRAGPPNLQRIEDAIDQLQSQTGWTERDAVRR